MGYSCTNELHNFKFNDCRIADIYKEKNDMVVRVDALIVGASNSKNGNYTDSYADTALIRFTDAKLIGCVKDGYRYYDAADRLIEEVADTPLTPDETRDFTGRCRGAYLYETNKCEDIDGYELEIEFVDEEDGTAADSYRLKVSCTDVIVNWDRYLNRVQGV